MATNDAKTQSQSQTPRTGILNLCGIKVGFPSDLRPYKSQLGLMAKAVTGVKKAQNCLLESPTGSGKTMAMLCSLLAWQKTLLDEQDEALKAFRTQLVMENRMEYYDADQFPLTPLTTKANEGEEKLLTTNRMKFIEEWSPSPDITESMRPSMKNKANTSRCMSPDLFADDDDDDLDAFKPPKKKKQITVSHDDEKITVVNLENSPVQSPAIVKNVKVAVISPGMPSIKPPPKMKIPKIFYATRTHKQIAQVISELNRTQYKDTKMTILSSREHSCIHQLVTPYPNKTEMCHALLDGSNPPNAEGVDEWHPKEKLGCTFKTKLDKLKSVKSALLDYLEVATPWDIEDLVQGGKNKKCCPYYASRELMSTAKIVFCPYNYIIDPLIRKSMDITLKNNIIVFDEAHNIEDTIRTATSYSLEEKSLNEAIKTCQIAIYQGAHKGAYTEVKRVLEIMLAWMKENSQHLKIQDNISNDKTCIYIGTQYVAHMENKGIGASHFPIFKSAVDVILTADSSSNPSSQEDEDSEMQDEANANKPPQAQQLFKPNQSFKNVVEGLNLVWNLMYRNESKNRDDYNIVLYETTTRYFAPEHSNEQADGGWVRRAKVSAQAQLGLHFWCMNPGVGFADFQDTHSVIVTSGTLSPMASFQSELGVLFPHPLSADHVIDPSQAWVATVSVGPSNRVIHGTYKNTVTLEYQDEIGSAILKICQTVPFGVLCFFPSYATLDKVMLRWQQTGKWNELLQCKSVFKEPRTQGEFLEAMTSFGLAVKRAENDWQQGVFGNSQTGALFLAVFRGKLSEGIDFKDNYARAVITVSIPFPSLSDLNVKLKKKYNDKNNMVNKNLLPGNQWYEIQAYRAINQALGRCIRHRNDWGAIIMLDDRFTPGGKATGSLSKWATKQIKHFQDWNHMHSMLQDFMQQRLAMHKVTPPVKDEIIIDLT